MSEFDHQNNLRDLFLTRRELISRMGNGFASLGLMGLLSESAQASDAGTFNPMSPRKPPLRARAKRVIFLFMNGGPSQVDTFDPKPALQKYAGQAIPLHLPTERKTGAAFPSPFGFQKYGQSGIEVSEIFPSVAKHVDDLCVIRSMHADVPNHEPSLMLMNCGNARLVRPSMGSWVTYGLGSENQNLPGFIAMCPNGYPIQDTQNWQSGFLPGVFQGTYINTAQNDIKKIIEFIKNTSSTPAEQRAQLDLLQELNQK